MGGFWFGAARLFLQLLRWPLAMNAVAPFLGFSGTSQRSPVPWRTELIFTSRSLQWSIGIWPAVSQENLLVRLRGEWIVLERYSSIDSREWRFTPMLIWRIATSKNSVCQSLNTNPEGCPNHCWPRRLGEYPTHPLLRSHPIPRLEFDLMNWPYRPWGYHS
jgi:hypothetical protein